MRWGETLDEVVHALQESLSMGSAPRIQLAVAVILVDLAEVDNAFVKEERDYILLRLRTVFRLSEADCRALMARARDIVQACEVQDSLAAGLRIDMPVEQRQAILEYMDQVMVADHIALDLERRLSERYRRLLGV
ncbi:MAG: TerB family tellurite resistance protein [Gammaproteobacteria bacterium]|nr:TerB family tellurite resistance protein [Gammaproteobacteria bacterium]